MDGEELELEQTPEEKQAEEEALAGVEENDLRDKVAEELGIDPDEESELLDKIVQRDMNHHKKLSGAIKQKRTWRDRAKKLPKKDQENPDPGKSPTKKYLTPEEADSRFEELMEKRELKSLNLPEEVETEIITLAKVKGISVREAAQHPYIVSMKEELDREKRVKSAAPKRGGRGSYAPSYDPSKPLNSEDFDLNTEDGIKDWEEAKKAKRQAMK